MFGKILDWNSKFVTHFSLDKPDENVHGMYQKTAFRKHHILEYVDKSVGNKIESTKNNKRG